MADVEFSHDLGASGHDATWQDADARNVNALTTWTNMAGALVSLALIAGVGVWGYELMVRDVSGIPVVKALGTEMRVRPEEPGGQLAEHQGLAVNEIAANGAASGPVDQVVLAPAGVGLTQEDQPVVAARTAPVLQPAPLAPAAEIFAADPPVQVAEEPQEDLAERLQKGAIDEVVAELMGEIGSAQQADGHKVVKVASVSGEIPVAQPAVQRLETIASDVPGVRLSVRPRLRPEDAPSMIQPAAYVPEAETSEIDADAIPSGTRLAQLGAFDSPDVARSEWATLQTRFGDMLDGKSRVVQQAQSGGRTFYRLRAMGFVDLSDARRFCSAFRAEGVDCIPVLAK